MNLFNTKNFISTTFKLMVCNELSLLGKEKEITNRESIYGLFILNLGIFGWKKTNDIVPEINIFLTKTLSFICANIEKKSNLDKFKENFENYD